MQSLSGSSEVCQAYLKKPRSALEDLQMGCDANPQWYMSVILLGVLMCHSMGRDNSSSCLRLPMHTMNGAAGQPPLPCPADRLPSLW